MAMDIVSVNEEALAKAADILARCSAEIREIFSEVLSEVRSLEPEWDDDDFTTFVGLLSAYEAELDQLDERSNVLITKANTKIELIHALHQTEIGK